MFKRILIVSGMIAAMVLRADGTDQGRTGSRDAAIGKAAFEASVRARIQDRRDKCMSVVGHAGFCDCVSGSLPLDVDFERYLDVSMRRQQNLVEARILAAVLSTRNRCVTAAFGTAP